jgi:hypothetical protein
MAKTAKGLSWNDLCALCLLPSHLLVFNSGGYRKREILFAKNYRITKNRREPGARRDAEIYIK